MDLQDQQACKEIQEHQEVLVQQEIKVKMEDQVRMEGLAHQDYLGILDHLDNQGNRDQTVHLANLDQVEILEPMVSPVPRVYQDLMDNQET